MTRRELLFLQGLTGLSFIITFVCFRAYLPAVASFGDNWGYLTIAKDIQGWHFAGLEPKLFWGAPYAIALVSMVFHWSGAVSLDVISIASCFGSVIVARNLWGGWVAAFFLATNFAWIQRCFLGGSEPLFVLLIFASLAYARKERWPDAALLASLATIVRPLGIFLLLAIGLVLSARKRYQECSLAVVVSLVIGFAYMLPLWLYFGDPLATYHGYHHDWDSASPIGLPLVALLRGAFAPGRPLTNLLLNGAWFAFAILGCVLMLRNFRCVRPERRIEWLFALLYLGFLLTYNSTVWAFSELPRFLIPVAPILLSEIENWLPRKRALVYPLAFCGGVLAAISAVGLRNVFH